MSDQHWMTRNDNNGDPYDTPCWCDIDADHYLNGKLAAPNRDSSESGASS